MRLAQRMMLAILLQFTAGSCLYADDATNSEVTRRLVPITSPVHPGSEIDVKVIYENTASQTVKANLDPTLPAKCGPVDVVLTAKGQYATRIVRLSPGEQYMVTYRLKLPEQLEPTFVLRLLTSNIQPSTLPASQPASAPGFLPGDVQLSVSDRKMTKTSVDYNQEMLRVFLSRIRPHEPIYFLWGTDDPQVKFQISTKFKLFDIPDSRFDTLNSLYFGYTQISLWNTGRPSEPFFDTAYKPELLYFKDLSLDPITVPYLKLTAFQAGLQHESNGKDGADSRSIPGMLYIQPTFQFDFVRDFNLVVQPRAHVNIGGLNENPDIASYRGYFDLRAVLNAPSGISLSVLGRIGSGWDHGSAQFDLTVPIPAIDAFLQAQYFIGDGESLKAYNRNSEQLRFGIGFIR